MSPLKEKVDRSHLIHEAKMHLLGLNADEILELMSSVLMEKREAPSIFHYYGATDPEVKRIINQLVLDRKIGGN